MLKTLDITDKWEENSWLSKQEALIPMRAQPLHNGHVNLILNICDKFKSVCVMIAQTKVDEKNPYSSAIRKKWLENLQKIYKLGNMNISEIGNSQLPDINSQKKGYLKLVSNDDPIFITGNNAVLQKCEQDYFFKYMCATRMKLSNLLNHEYFESFYLRDSLARIIRKAIREKTDLPETLVPDFIPFEELINEFSVEK